MSYVRVCASVCVCRGQETTDKHPSQALQPINWISFTITENILVNCIVFNICRLLKAACSENRNLLIPYKQSKAYYIDIDSL